MFAAGSFESDWEIYFTLDAAVSSRFINNVELGLEITVNLFLAGYFCEINFIFAANVSI
jgi:hypothetical protein